MEERGVPVLISVETDWLWEARVEVAAEERAVIMEGPGKRWALVMWAQWAMRRGPEVYCFWTVSGGVEMGLAVLRRGCAGMREGIWWGAECGRWILTAYIAEFPILEYQKLLPPADFLEAHDGAVGKVVDDVGVGFEHAYRVADFFGELQEGGGGCDVGRDAQIGPLNRDELKQVGG